MDANQHQRVMKILGEALEQEPDQRDGWLASACAGDEHMRSEVGRLLDHQKSAPGFLEESPFAAAMQIDSEPEPVIGNRIGTYKTIQELGRGGMGVVYLAERDDQEFARQAAIKVIKRGMDTDFVLQRFRNERQILANLDHPNIARLLDGGTTSDGLPYFIMEYVEGKSIVEYADIHELTTTERLKLFRTVCSAVQYAHQHLVIHRDIKPSNILVTEEGEPKLLDFGIAKLLQADSTEDAQLTATAVLVMTPEYASPEQIKGERITTSTDVYSLGVLLYELLTGHRPYRVNSRSVEEVGRAVCEQQPEKPSQSIANVGLRTKEVKSNPQSESRNPKLLRGDLDNIVLKALRKEAQRRYASVEQFSEDIRRHIAGLPVSARKDTLSYRTSKFVQRNRLGVAAAALILLALGGGMVATAIEARRANRRFNDVRRLAHSVLFDYNDQIAALPGSTKVRERLVKDSLEYLDNLSLEAGSDRSLMRERAAAYEKVAAVQGGVAMSGRGALLSTSNLGDMPGALESLRKALAIRERVFAMEPNNKEVQQELSYCYAAIGFLYVLNGPPEKAVESLRKGMPTMEALLAADPTNEDLQYKLWNMYMGLAKALGNPAVPNLGDTNGAMAYMDKAQAVGERFASDHPTNPLSAQVLGSLYNAFGQMFRGAGKQQEALDSFKKAVAVDQELIKRDPSNTHNRRSQAVNLGNVGSATLAMNDQTGSIGYFKQALAIYESMVSADPNDAAILREAGVGNRNLGAALGGTGDRVGALNNFHKALQVFTELVAKDPNNADFRRQWATTYLSLSRFQSQANDLSGAIDSALSGIKIDEALVIASPTNALARNTLAQLYSQLGAYHAALAAKAGASKQTEHWLAAKDADQKSLEIYQEMKSKGTLGGADAGKPDDLAREIAKCDAVLAKLH